MTYPDATAPATPEQRPRIDQATIDAGFRSVFQILDAWVLTPDQAKSLLGQPAHSTFYKWKRGEVGSVQHDTVRRVSYILGIYQALQILYRDPVLADGWIKRPNAAFGGRSALDRMTGGDIADLAVVRDCLDSARGGWA